jgi:hypothetical protein
LAKAQDDSVYLGYLYEAWKQAQAGQPGYTIDQVGIENETDRSSPTRAWAVLKGGKIV